MGVLHRLRDHARHLPDPGCARHPPALAANVHRPTPLWPTPLLLLSLYQGFVLLFSGDTLFQVLEQGWKKMVSARSRSQHGCCRSKAWSRVVFVALSGLVEAVFALLSALVG